ncbi:MAG: pyridoxamine 5'-phosphate oxidase family protein [Oscillospiraceae bacterium]|jgi:nitroimidazol reductase NimA-like FMN-containing flavoprotein (pyridoxamine 5'-phosphate oxidase superfamily)|nr:pyridoxamine 5'-phosphate oxidase family protein [Oscillospiraceae bacterium]
MRRKDREVSDRAGIENILSRCKTCHVAMIDGDIPYVVPLSYGYRFLEGGRLELYFHSAAEGRKLDILKKNPKVCFEASCEGAAVSLETPCDSGYFFASVIGIGEAVFILDDAGKCDALFAMFYHQTGREVAFLPEQAKNVCVFKIVSYDYTGKERKKPDMA